MKRDPKAYRGAADKLRQKGKVGKKCLMAFLSNGTNDVNVIGADRIGEFACAKFSSRCRRQAAARKGKYEKESIEFVFGGNNDDDDVGRLWFFRIIRQRDSR